MLVCSFADSTKLLTCTLYSFRGDMDLGNNCDNVMHLPLIPCDPLWWYIDKILLYMQACFITDT